MSEASPEIKYEFHLAEFNQLKAEAAAILSSEREYFKYAIISSGGIFAWMFAQAGSESTIINQNTFQVGLWLPLILTCALGARARAYGERTRPIGRYLARLELVLGLRGMGWETSPETRPARIEWAVSGAWIILVIGDVLLPSLVRLGPFVGHHSVACTPMVTMVSV